LIQQTVLDETGVLLETELTRSPRGSRVYDLKPFIEVQTVVGAISLTHVVALMTLDGSMDGDAINVFIEKFSTIMVSAVVVMDNLPAHKMASLNL